MQPFEVQMPRIVFGSGSRARIPALLEELTETAAGGRRLLIVSSRRRSSDAAWRQWIHESLAGFPLSWIACPPGEPTVEGTDQLLEEARRVGPDAIVAVGGGSVLDTAKVLSGLCPREGSVLEYLEGIGSGATVGARTIPWLAVPTTAGTGAEASWNAVVKSRRHGLKRSLRSRRLAASWAVVDPELTGEAPPEVTGSAGMDALAQLIEAYVTRKSNPCVRPLVRDAFPRHLAALRVLAERPRSLEARSEASYGALVSGIALANAGLGAVHGFAAALGGMTDLPHGLICAVFLPPVLRANAEAIREPLRELCSTLGLPDGTDPVEWLSAEVGKLLDSFGLPRRLGAGLAPAAASSRFGSADLVSLAEASSGSSMSGNPVSLDSAARVRILREVLLSDESG